MELKNSMEQIVDRLDKFFIAGVIGEDAAFDEGVPVAQDNHAAAFICVVIDDDAVADRR